MGVRLMVGHQTLNLLMEVRILHPQCEKLRLAELFCLNRLISIIKKRFILHFKAYSQREPTYV